MSNPDEVKNCIKRELSFLESNIHALTLLRSKEVIINYIGTIFFLEALSFELAIKLFYVLDKNTIHKKTHNIDELFNELNDSTKELIKKIFDDEVVSMVKFSEEKIGEKLYIPKFNEILLHNEKIVKDFKYDLKLANGSLVNLDYIVKLYKEIKLRSRNITD